MSLWLLKSAVQRLISLCPNSDRLNAIFQRHVTGGLRIRPEGEFRAKLEACRRHLDNYRTWSPGAHAEFTVLELGTGWFPIIPLGLYLCGAAQIWTFDIVPLLRVDALKTVIDYFSLFHQTGELDRILPETRRERLWSLLNARQIVDTDSPSIFLENLNIHCRIGSLMTADLAENSIDLIFSNGVLEHLSGRHLGDVFLRFRRFAAVDSVMSHFIGIADQFASFDKSITKFNYMRYSERVWRILNNPMIPMNRLRASDYRRICTQAGFSIKEEQLILGEEGELDKVKLAPEFKRYSKQDLLGLYLWLIATPN